jgi:hypothetical protein
MVDYRFADDDRRLQHIWSGAGAYRIPDGLALMLKKVYGLAKLKPMVQDMYEMKSLGTYTISCLQG